jgi:hypothetical protein
MLLGSIIVAPDGAVLGAMLGDVWAGTIAGLIAGVILGAVTGAIAGWIGPRLVLKPPGGEPESGVARPQQ